ncbi:MAG: hypothetical protein COB46_13535, partial [Rhodospirillaceae bacterium]
TTNPALASNNSFNFTGVPGTASGGGTLVISAMGDLDLSYEDWNIQDENGVALGSIGGSGTQCGTVFTITITLSDAQLNAWATDGNIDFTALDPSGSDVNTTQATLPTVIFRTKLRCILAPL